MAKKIPWDMIKADYEAKGIGVSELERIYNVGKSTIHYRITKEQWQRFEIQYPKQLQLENVQLEINKLNNLDEIEKLKLVVELEKYRYLNRSSTTIVTNKKGAREKAALDTIEQLLGIKLIRQFEVGGFKIDGYDIENKVAYEIDEEQHNSKKHSQHDVLRQKFIEEQLSCTFIRIKV